MEQIKRVQRYVETLDAIKIKNAMPRANGRPQAKEQPQWPHQKSHQPHHHQQQMQQKKMHLQQPQNGLPQQPVVVTTNWETFDSLFMPSTTTPTPAASSTPHAKLDWELF